MASSVENGNVSEIVAVTQSQVTDSTEPVELGEGRVWRRGNITSTSDKQKNTGPVLRTTVKPVKRFRPDSNNDKTNPSPSRKKRLKNSGTSSTAAAKSDEGLAASHSEVTTKSKANVHSSVVSPERKASLPESDKNEKCNSSETQGDERKDAPVKKKRVWEQWSVEDKDYFFEAVAMYGKDFEAIRTAIAQKHRKKGEACIAKTKDQVRHLYYRTWTMINKMIDPSAYPMNINKAFQELYAVINYGELRKKLGSNLKKKGIEKLNELIKDGTTSARFKGKNFRIKTPSCRALKKMNPEYQGIHDMPLVSDTRKMKIPLHVTIELCPLTMADWNQVHSVAHNPRIRIRLSVESPLSSVFGFLERKWKPLSGRILSFVEQGQLKSHPSAQKPSVTQVSEWDGTLILQTPPDVSVNTRIMVFQVVNNKAHCIVSYALRKSTQISDRPKSAESVIEPATKKMNEAESEETSDILTSKLPTAGFLSESEAVDSCLSSEEDYDYDSATEDAPKDGCKLQPQQNADCLSKETVEESGGEVQSLDTTFTLKDKESFPDSPAQNAESKAEVEAVQEYVEANEKVIHLTCNVHSTSAEPSISCNSVVANTEENEQAVVLEGPEDKFPREESDSPNSGNCSAAKDSTVSVSCDSAPTLMDPEQPLAGKTKKRKKLLVSSKLFGESTKGKRQRNTKKNKSFIKMVQKWNSNDCGKTTVAEVYMMLGKPSVFRLCYHWLRSASQNICDSPNQGSERQPDDKSSCKLFPLSTGLTALIQAACLSTVDDEVNKNQADMAVRRTSKSTAKTKSTAVQCDIIKPNHKADDRQRSQNPATNNLSNPHGRGISKIIPVETVIVDNLPISGFAVPAVPVNRPRRIAANPNKPIQGTKVSAETMNWLLQRERSRSNRLLRRPIVVDRSSSQRSNRSNNRPMKTFSIVTKGPNKIGFLPSQPILAPKIPTNSPEGESSLYTEQSQGTTAGGFDDLDKLLSDNFTGAVNGEILSGNLLMQAAKEAGVTPPTPVKTSEQSQNSGKDLDDVAISSATVSDQLASTLCLADETVSKSVDTVVGADSPCLGEADKSTLPIVGNIPPDPHIPDSTVESRDLLTPLSHDLTTPTTNPMVYPTNLLGSSPTIPSASSLCVNSTVVNSLPELSWPGNDISSSAFPIMSETFIDKLVDGEADVVLSSLTSNLPHQQTKQTNESSNSRHSTMPTLLDEGSNGPSLSRMSFDLQMTPVKSSEVPVHPWTINTNSRESVGLSNLLNTPQKIVSSDSEDSLYGIRTSLDSSPKKSKENASCSAGRIADACDSSPVADIKSRSQDHASSNFLVGADTAVDVHLQSLINENSVDLVSKFQDLVRHTTDCDDISALTNDENARDGHVLIEASFPNADVLTE